MAAKKVVPSKGVRRTDGSSQRAESQRQAGMRRSMPVDRLASQRRDAALMATRPVGPTAAFVVPGQQATGLSSGPAYVGRPLGSGRTPVVNMNTAGGRFSLRGTQGPIHPDSFGAVAGWAAGIPMGAASAIPYSRAAQTVKSTVSKVTKPVVSKVTNAVRGEAVALHGSPTTGIRTVEPRWSITDVDRPTVSVMRTDIPRDLREPSLVEKYAGGSGSVYVVGVKKAETNLPKFPKGPWSGEPTVYTKSNAPARVLAEVRKQDYYMWDDFLDAIQSQVRLAGGGRFNNMPRTNTAAKIVRKVRRNVR